MVTSEAQSQSQKQSPANAVMSVAGSVPSSTHPFTVSMPMQKRRRVTRACDECRRKKIKCDGKQPCTHCTVYSYGQYWKALLRRCIRRSQIHKANRSFTQIVPMTNRRIEDAIQPLNMSKHWKTDSSALKLSSVTSFPMSISMTPIVSPSKYTFPPTKASNLILAKQDLGHLYGSPSKRVMERKIPCLSRW